MKVNLNSRVKVRPTKYCWSILAEKFLWVKLDKTYSHMGSTNFAKEYYKWDGEFLTIPLWDICNLFGESFYMGNNNLPIDLNIEIIEENS